MDGKVLQGNQINRLVSAMVYVWLLIQFQNGILENSRYFRESLSIQFQEKKDG